jgi:hypothetical protein
VTEVRKHIGNFGVDSGQVLIVDPCYLDDWKTWDSTEVSFENHKTLKGEFGYLGACGVTLSEGFGEVESGVVSTTGYGDGVYPVFATITSDNRVAKLEIVFIQDEDEDF